MKKSIAVLLSLLMILSVFQGCNSDKKESKTSSSKTATTNTTNLTDKELVSNFNSLDEPELLQYVEDTVYSDLSAKLKSDDYTIEDISNTFLSQEYVEELKYNSKENTYFGFKLSELNEQFTNTKYVFTLGEDGKTTVTEIEKYDDTLEKIITNVAIGSGVILTCVTVSVITDGLGFPAVSAIFASAAETGADFALSSTLLSGTMSAIITGIKTNDINQALKSALIEGSNGFKWGAIAGTVAGGFGQLVKTVKASKIIPSARESELLALKKFKGVEQKSYLNGIEVPYGTPGATRPDIVRKLKGNNLEAIEVKNWDLESSTNLSNLFKELKRQVSDRIKHMPEGTKQRIVLVTKGRNYSKTLIESVKNNIQNSLNGIYNNIPISIIN
ncbi:MAG: hypothetical protein UIH27_03540 [Ruminococcus sp.]|nr:hypothetical protein [Ruminococcus sp.]